MYLICTRSSHGGNILGKSDMTAPIRFGLLWDNGQRECIATARWPASTCAARSCPPPGCGPRCRAVASTWTRWCRRCARSSTRSPNAVPTPPSSTAKSSTGCGPPRVRVPAEKLDGALADLDPERARRARGGDRARPRRARRSAPHRHHDDARARRHGHRTLGAGRAGRPLRARRQRRLPVERGDERGAGADRRGRLAGDRQPAAGRSSAGCRTRRSWPPRACWASTRCGPSAARRRWRCWPTAAPTPTGPSWRPST